MAYEQNEESKISKFNAGVAQAERIDALQRAINSARYNLQMVNQDTQTFNFEVVLSSLDGLMMEGWSKATLTEQEMMQRFSNLIRNAMKLHPPVRIINQKGQEIPIKMHGDFENFCKLLSLYERLIKEVFEEHDLNAPSMKDFDNEY